MQGAPLGQPPGLLRFQPSQTEAKLPRQSKGDMHLGLRKDVRSIVVRHELADQHAILLNRNKSDCADALTRNGFLQVLRQIGCSDVLEMHGAGICFPHHPRRMSLHGLPVCIGEAAPGDKPHHAALIKQENGRPLTIKRPIDGIERNVMRLLDRSDVLKPVGKLKKHRLFMHPPREGLLGQLAVGNVVLHADGVKKLSVVIADAGGTDFRPKVAAVAPVNAFLD